MRAAAAVVLVLVLALPAGAAQPRRATLTLEAVAPLVVVGRGFGQGERVVLTASAKSARKSAKLVTRRTAPSRPVQPPARTLRAVHRPRGRRAWQQGHSPGRAGLRRETAKARTEASSRAASPCAEVERLVEGGVVDARLARDLTERAA